MAAGAAAILAAMSAAGTFGSAAAQNRDQGEEYRAELNAGAWAAGPNLPEARQDAAAAVVGGRIYVVGGYGPRAKQEDTTLVLEPQIIPAASPPADVKTAAALSRLGTWSYAAPIPQAIDHAAACELGGFLYVAGGRIGRRVSSRLWRYDPATDQWTALASMPIARYAPTLTGFDGKLYLIGGQTQGWHDPLAIEVYDPATDAWSVIKWGLSVEREQAASVILGNKIALVGGHDHEQIDLTDCDLFDPENGVWSSCARLHQARADFGLAEVHERLMAIGGFSLRADIGTQTSEISSQQARGWTGGPWMPSPRHGMSVVTLGNIIYVIGGSAWSGVAPMESVLRYVSPVTRVRLGPRVQHT